MIAYKLTNGLVSDSLPSNWITEWTYVDVQLEESIEGWLQLAEDEFMALLAVSNTDDNLKKFQDDINEARKAQIIAWRESQNI